MGTGFATIEEKLIYQKLLKTLPDGSADMQEQIPEDGSGGRLLFDKAGDSGLELGQIQSLIADIGRNLATLNNTRDNPAYRPLYSNKKVIGPVIVFFKKVVRKLMKWYIEPPCFQQTEFNGAVVPAIYKLSRLQEMQAGLYLSLKRETERQSKAYENRLAELERAAEENIRAVSLKWEKKYEELQKQFPSL